MYYNNISAQLQETESVGEFKHNLKNKLKQKPNHKLLISCYYHVYEFLFKNANIVIITVCIILLDISCIINKIMYIYCMAQTKIVCVCR